IKDLMWLIILFFQPLVRNPYQSLYPLFLSWLPVNE
ncbi:hypothetical protein NPIL_430511, partial [Nephila pilipes]